jgi:hypothetical protein
VRLARDLFDDVFAKLDAQGSPSTSRCTTTANVATSVGKPFSIPSAGFARYPAFWSYQSKNRSAPTAAALHCCDRRKPLRKQNQQTSAGKPPFMEGGTLHKEFVCPRCASFWGDSCDLAIVDELAASRVVLQYCLHNQVA